MTYPNVLVMRYLRETGQLTPELGMKLEQAIVAGWQRTLTFETIRDGGGFDWYGNPPAKTILTAYGLMLLADMEKIHPVDPAVAMRAAKVLKERQQGDGSWTLDAPMHTWRQLGKDRLPLTAYVAWALLESGRSPGAAIGWIEENLDDAKDSYVLALAANALQLAKSPRAKEALDRLESLARIDGEAATWETSIETGFHSGGKVANVETTALAALALVRAGRGAMADRAVTALVRAKDPQGGWASTQSTVLAIKALLEVEQGGGRGEPASFTLHVNGVPVAPGFESVTAANEGVVQQVDISSFVVEGENTIEVGVGGDRRVSVQVAGRYYLPWSLVPAAAKPPFEISVAYDKSTLAKRDLLRADVTLKRLGTPTFMVIADLGLPPGFSVVEDDLRALVEGKVIDKYSLTGRQITLYFGAVGEGAELKFSYGLRARFPMVAATTSSSVYEYYAPDRRATERPGRLEVTE